MPKCLVACPVSSRHSHLLDEWLNSLEELTYPNFDVMVVDTTSENDDYFELLKTKKVKNKNLIVERHKWDLKDQPVVMLAKAREKIRNYFLSKDYAFCFSLDDDIFIPKNSIQKLLSYDKDCIGFFVPIYYKPNQVPCVFKSGEIIMGKGLDYYSFKELEEYKKFADRFIAKKLTKKETNLIPFIIKDIWHPYLIKPYAVNIGCLIIKRKVLESVPFRYREDFAFGEDLWFFAEANDKKFEFWCDVSVRPIHKNTEWDSVVKKGPKSGGQFYIVLGPAESDKIVFMEHENENKLG